MKHEIEGVRIGFSKESSDCVGDYNISRTNVTIFIFNISIFMITLMLFIIYNINI